MVVKQYLFWMTAFKFTDGMLISQTSDGIERRFVQQNRFASREYVQNPQGGWEISASHVVNGTMLASHISSHSTGKTSPTGGRQQNTATHINYHPDHLGSVRLVTDEAGRIIDKPQTDAYGNPIPHKTATSTPGVKSNQNAKILQKFNFTGTHGIRYVEKIRMHNMRARWYGGSVGRFIAVDPYQKDKPNRMTNRFVYANDNPILFYDFTGLYSITPNTKDNVNKLNCAMKVIERICPFSASRGSLLPFHIRVMPYAWAAYIEAHQMIVLDTTTWNQYKLGDTNSTNWWALTILHEIIHHLQISYYKSLPFTKEILTWNDYLSGFHLQNGANGAPLNPVYDEFVTLGYDRMSDAIYETFVVYTMQSIIQNLLQVQSEWKNIHHTIKGYHPDLYNMNVYDPFLDATGTIRDLPKFNPNISLQSIPWELKRKIGQQWCYSIYCFGHF